MHPSEQQGLVHLAALQMLPPGDPPSLPAAPSAAFPDLPPLTEVATAPAAGQAPGQVPRAGPWWKKPPAASAAAVPTVGVAFDLTASAPSSGRRASEQSDGSASSSGPLLLLPGIDRRGSGLSSTTQNLTAVPTSAAAAFTAANASAPITAPMLSDASAAPSLTAKPQPQLQSQPNQPQQPQQQQQSGTIEGSSSSGGSAEFLMDLDRSLEQAIADVAAALLGRRTCPTHLAADLPPHEATAGAAISRAGIRASEHHGNLGTAQLSGGHGGEAPMRECSGRVDVAGLLTALLAGVVLPGGSDSAHTRGALIHQGFPVPSAAAQKQLPADAGLGLPSWLLAAAGPQQGAAPAADASVVFLPDDGDDEVAEDTVVSRYPHQLRGVDVGSFSGWVPVDGPPPLMAEAGPALVTQGGLGRRSSGGGSGGGGSMVVPGSSLGRRSSSGSGGSGGSKAETASKRRRGSSGSGGGSIQVVVTSASAGETEELLGGGSYMPFGGAVGFEATAAAAGMGNPFDAAAAGMEDPFGWLHPPQLPLPQMLAPTPPHGLQGRTSQYRGVTRHRRSGRCAPLFSRTKTMIKQSMKKHTRGVTDVTSIQEPFVRSPASSHRPISIRLYASPCSSPSQVHAVCLVPCRWEAHIWVKDIAKQVYLGGYEEVCGWRLEVFPPHFTIAPFPGYNSPRT